MKKIFCKGNKNNSIGVIKVLEKYGGKNLLDYNGSNENCYYYIDCENDIIRYTKDNTFKKLILQNFRELNPISNFQRGDLLVSNINNIIVIFDQYTANNKFFGYVLFSNSSIKSGYDSTFWDPSEFHIITKNELNKIDLAINDILNNEKEK